jgi:hypothetical protein
MSAQRALKDYEKSLIANVHEYGCQIVSVVADEASPPFSYSVGFWETVGQPEAIIFGMNSEMGHYALMETLRQCEAGLALRDGQRLDELLKDYDVVCVARDVHPRHLVPQYFNSALWYHRRRTGADLPAAVQLVWPDEGVWPWDPEASAAFLEEQPALYDGTLQ